MIFNQALKNFSWFHFAPVVLHENSKGSDRILILTPAMLFNNIRYCQYYEKLEGGGVKQVDCGKIGNK